MSYSVRKALKSGALTEDKINDAIERCQDGEFPGLCLHCGAEHDGVDPDGRNDMCDECGQKAVFGAEEIALMVA